ncbi:hypothetical protein TrLO_g10264 [Triparma laevis f. longispina]|uniref:Uncharacterized protein n=1 Tax=Triparma laevis f. longispina TaxID=1714387 RepID=A0A9W7KYE6_9STRA|nr:hypothetical protein TrLO_g10264 [Triparma laevis f. longispina]
MKLIASLIALTGLTSGSASQVTKAAEPPPFFLQDTSDGLCLSGSVFKRCAVDTLWYVTGSPGEYQIHLRPTEEGGREQCLAKKTCTDATKPEEVRLSKCSHCGSKKWNILGDAQQGYVLSFDSGKTCLVREPKTNKALTVSCETTEYSYTPLQLNFASKDDIKTMSSPGARLVTSANSGIIKEVKKALKDGVNVNSVDWDQLTPLIAASQGGHVDVVKHLVNNGANVDAVDKDGISSLMEASIAGHIKVVQFLVDKDADVNLKAGSDVNAVWLAAGEGKDVTAKRMDGIGALASAAVAGHEDVVKVLLKNKEVNVNESDNEGLTPVMNVCEHGSVVVLKMLVKAGGDVNAVSVNGFTALIVASAAGNLDQVKFLLDSGAEVDAMHEEGVTALMYAAASGHLEVVELLVSKGAEVDKRHSNGGTALMECAASASEGNVKVVEFLIKKGADHAVVDNDGVTPLMSAASQGQCKVVDLLLEKEKNKNKDVKPHVNLAATSGGTALMFASGAGKDDCVKSLLTAGADLNMLVEAQPEYLDRLAKSIEAGEETEAHVDGINSLMIAAAAGHLNTCKMLIEAGADVLVKDEEDKSALAAAVKGNFGEVASLLVENGADANDAYVDEEGVEHNLLHDSIIIENHEFSKLLIKNGADLSHVDESGVTTLLQASHRGMSEVVVLLLQYDKDSTIDVNASNEDGISALIAASSEGHSEIVKALLKGKADVNAKDKDQTTALMAAAVRGHGEICGDLLSAGAEIDNQNIDGHTAIMFAYNGFAQVQTLWARYQSYLEESNEKDDEANSKIIKEALANHTAVVNLLTKRGADLTLRDNEGHTAADFDYHPEVDGDALEQAKVEEKRKQRIKGKKKKGGKGEGEEL